MNILKTKRLSIRKPCDEDVDAIYEIQNTPYVLRYNGLKEMNKKQIHTMLMDKDEPVYMLEMVNSQKVIGAISNIYTG